MSIEARATLFLLCSLIQMSVDHQLNAQQGQQSFKTSFGTFGTITCYDGGWVGVEDL